MLLLSDFWPHGSVAQEYGVLREHGFTERAVIIVDEEGIVRFKHVYDFDEMPDIDALVSAVEQINASE